LKEETDLIILGDFCEMRKPLKFKCITCSHEFKTSPNHIKNDGSRCIKCVTDEKFSDSQIIFKKFLSEQTNISMVSEFYNMCTKVSFKCNDCSNTWEAKPTKIKRGISGCHNCTIKKVFEPMIEKSKKEFFSYLETRDDIKLIGKYEKANIKVNIQCTVCDLVWKIMPTTIKSNNSGCPNCHIKIKAQKAKMNYKKDFLESINKNKKVVLIGEYIDSITKTKFKCSSCSHAWMTRPSDIKLGISSCVKCSPFTISKGEYFIEEYLLKNNISFIPQWKEHTCVYKRKLPYDFYLPAHNLAIEFQGIQHYQFVKRFHRNIEGFELQKKKDGIKRNYCKLKNIPLLEISYDQINDIEEIIERYLKETIILSH
jgi:hypothetical protein